MAGIIALGVAYFLSQFYRSFLAVMTPSLRADLGMTAPEMSNALGIWFIAFALMQFPLGGWLDRFGPRWPAALPLAVAGAGGAILFAVATAPWHVILAMALIGIGCSPVLMASLVIYARRFRPDLFATATALLIGTASFGNLLAAEPMALAIDALGWRTCMAVIAAVTLAVAVAIFLSVSDQTAEPSTGDSGSFWSVLGTRALWPIFAIMFVAYAAPAGLRGVWIGPYFADTHSFDGLAIGRETFWMAIALALGALAIGPLDRVFGTRKGIVVGACALTATATALLALAPDRAPWQATVLFVLIGLCGMSYVTIMAHGRAFVPAAMTGRGVTVLNFFSISGAGLFQYLTGFVFTAAQAGGTAVSAYSAVFASYAVALSLAIAWYLFAEDAKP
ncbi:MAG: MFS transporter [Pseudomonadota bacterium]